MIELPRAALTADQIAEPAEFFSFGTNDLTQTTWGFSRDVVEAAFFSAYLEKGIFGVSPFESIDREGVGELVRIAAERVVRAAPASSSGFAASTAVIRIRFISSRRSGSITSRARRSASPSPGSKPDARCSREMATHLVERVQVNRVRSRPRASRIDCVDASIAAKPLQ